MESLSLTSARKPRVGLVALYFNHVEYIMDKSFRREKEELGHEIANVLGEFADVCYHGLIDSIEEGIAAAQQFVSVELDAVVFFSTMAAPPSYGWECLRQLQVPVLVWNGQIARRVPDSLNYQDVNRYGANVGTVMITNVLLREQRPFHLVSGYYRDAQTIAKVKIYVEAVAAVNRLRRARVGRIGQEIPGYADVTIDDGMLRDSLGTEVIDIQKPEVEERYDQVTQERITDLLSNIKTEYEVTVPLEILSNSVRIALALEDIVTRNHLDAVAINCHSEIFRENPHIGLVGCYGASRLTGMGIPFSCTGDVPTAVAMLILKSLGGQSQYGDCVMTDLERDFVLLTNTGEGDPAIARTDGRKCLIQNENYPGVRGCGANPLFQCRSGSATMVAFSPQKASRGGHVIVAALGEVLGVSYDDTRVTTAAFRFRNRSSVDGYDHWCRAGAPHHGGLTLGDYTEHIRHIGELWGVETVLI